LPNFAKIQTLKVALHSKGTNLKVYLYGKNCEAKNCPTGHRFKKPKVALHGKDKNC
jgi:hypothetical protein